MRIIIGCDKLKTSKFALYEQLTKSPKGLLLFI